MARSEKLADQVSIILLTYNCAHRLGPILDRVLELNVPVVAVDNASADRTCAVLADRNVDVIRLSKNIGAAARNVGVERVRTPYVAFCDDDGWYERDGLGRAVEVLDQHPSLAIVNARILVGRECRLDWISQEMDRSPLLERHGIPGKVLVSFMAGASVARVQAFLSVGGYDPRFFMGGEEETVAYKLLRAGWHMRYVPEVVVHHHPSVANAPRLRAFGMRNTLWNAWLHRRFPSAVRWTIFTLWDTPKNRDWVRGVGMAVQGAGWVVRNRHPMQVELDRTLLLLDKRRFIRRRPILTRRENYSTARVMARSTTNEEPTVGPAT